MRVTVLFAARDSIYKSLPELDVWDEDRNALKWPGGSPVVAHPPCRLWGRMRQFSKAPKEEMELARFAVRAVREHGGVLEHPAHSTLWKDMQLPPPRAGIGGRQGITVEAPQWWWGHRAPKLSWFYIVGVAPNDLPPIPSFHLLLGGPTHLIRTSKSDRHKPHPPTLTKPMRDATPRQMAEWLVAVASRVALD